MLIANFLVAVTDPIFHFLTQPYMVTILLMIGLIGIAVEFSHPGLGVPGIIGFLAFALYFYAQFEAGFGNWLSPALFILSIFLVMIEFLVPGVGIFGIAGIVLMLYSVVSAASNLVTGIISLAIAIAITIVVLWILVKFFGMKFMIKKIVLISEQKNEEGYRSSESREELLGKTGITVTPLRPAGIVQFDDRREDVVSEGELIPANVKVVVIRVEGSRVVVRRAKDEEPKSEKSGE